MDNSFVAADLTDITILSVIYSHQTEDQILENYRLVSALNPSRSFHWVVGYNFSLKFPGPNVARFKETNLNLVRCLDNDDQTLFNSPITGAQQHGAALNLLRRLVNTRFLLILDPDFFIIENDWINQVIGSMGDSGLSFFGSTWDPKNYKKFRGFPSIHCFFSDLSRVALNELDFGVEIQNRPKISPIFQKIVKKLPNSIKLLFDRSMVQVNSDPGSAIYRKFGRSAHQSSTLIPYFQRFSTDRTLSLLYFLVLRLSDLFFPAEKRIIPDPRYYSKRNFSDHGCAIALPAQWEQFFWNHKPFAFHIRSTLTIKDGKAFDLQQLRTIIDTSISRCR